jgi:hypothetical protein
MGLLDKLKPQPRWKHADPTVRLEAVRELEDAIELAALAEGDPDARVRRAAIARTADPEVLGRIFASDADGEAKDRAADRLLALAMTGHDEGTALAATRALADPRRLSALARSEAPDAVRAEALARTTDSRALSSIARHAKHETTAAAALDRLSDADELLDVALNAEHKDVALRAFDRIVAGGADVALLRSVETRAQQKAVAKRARLMIQEIEEAEAARRAAEEARREREAAVCESVERLAGAGDAVLISRELEQLTETWRALETPSDAAEARFKAASSQATAAILRLERAAEEAAELARRRAEAIATRDALCQRVETLDGEDSLDQLHPIEEEWRSLLPLVGDGPEADRLAERFAQAVAACRKRHELGATLAETRTRLEALAVEAEALPSQDDSAAASRWPALAREARGLAAILKDALRPADDLTARFDAVEAAFVARDQARREALHKAQQDVAGQLARLAERARRAAEAETITLREGDRLMRDIRTGLDQMSRVESSKDVEDAARSLREWQEKVAPRVRELREMDDWRRFANAQRQEQFIAMAEAIVKSLKSDEEAGTASDLAATARALRELHAKWQEVAEAPRQSAQRLWDRFRTATDFIRSRCETFFVQQREERVTNLQQKTALVEEAEALVSSTDWVKTTARFEEMQKAWQAIGPVPREAGRELAQRFRTACNSFFARRREDLASRKKMWADNLAKKEALCERAEALVESTDWDHASAELKRMQAEWKTVGPVRRNKSEVVWERFRAAADRFFERYHNRHQIALATKLADREAMVVELESLIGADGEAMAEDLAARVQQLRTTWNRSVPIPSADVKPIIERWQQALTGVVAKWPAAFAGTDLDPAAVRTRMEKLVARVEALLGDDAEEPARDLSPTELLAARLRSALASNAMGGRGGEESKWRAAADAVRDAQSAWQRLGPTTDPEARALETRFREACRRVLDHARRHQGPSHHQPRRPHPGGGGQGQRHEKPTAALA